jgi:hypothetical protein
MVLVGLAEVGLLEEERYAEHALPEIDRALPRRPHDGDVVDSLRLYFRHPALLEIARIVAVIGPGYNKWYPGT